MEKQLQRIKIGEILVGNGFISREELEEALEIQEKNGGLLGMILLNRGLISRETLHAVLSAQNRDN